LGGELVHLLVVPVAGVGEHRLWFVEEPDLPQVDSIFVATLDVEELRCPEEAVL
jgi:hypothetical protein